MRRAAARKAMLDHDISQRRACKLVGVDPKTVRRDKPPDSPEVRKEMKAIASKRRRFGYRRIGVLLERKGMFMNHKKHEFDTLCSTLSIEHRLTPPRSPQTNGMVERFNGRIEEVLQSHHFRSGDELGTTLHRYVWLYNHQLPQSALGSKTPLQAMKQWHKLKPELFKKQPYYLTGCDTYPIFRLNSADSTRQRNRLVMSKE